MQKKPDIDRIQFVKDALRTSGYGLDDRFVIRDGKIHKCAVICPGGAYATVCSYIEGVPIARALNQKGISCVIVYYRVGRKAHYPNPQDDLARAIKEIMSKADSYAITMEGYSVWGASAGGHLVGTFGTTSMGYPKYDLPRPSALILTYPVITLEKALTHAGTRDNLLGKNARDREAFACSVHTNLDENYPPTFIWCGDADSIVSPRNTKLMTEAMKHHQIRYESHIYPGVEHGVGPGTGTVAEGWIDEAVKFWMN